MHVQLSLARITEFVSAIVTGRDPGLAEHHSRMAHTARAFGEHLGLPPEQCDLLTLGVSLHDAGKLFISEYILNKPARLTSAEFRLVQQHTQFGEAILRPLNLHPRIHSIVASHHENFDGSGYPRGLRGSEIPALARVARLLDSFDALTEERPYHHAVGPEEALDRMRRDARCYDPLLLSEFSGMLTNGANES